MKRPIPLCIISCKLKILPSYFYSNSNHFSSFICQHKRTKKIPLSTSVHKCIYVLFKVDGCTFPNLRYLPGWYLAPGWMLQLRTLVSTLKPLQRWALNKKYLYFIWTGNNIVKKWSIFPVISKYGIYGIQRCFHTLSKLLMCKSGLPGY